MGLNPSRDAGATEGTGGAAAVSGTADRGGGGMHVCKEAAGVMVCVCDAMQARQVDKRLCESDERGGGLTVKPPEI